MPSIFVNWNVSSEKKGTAMARNFRELEEKMYARMTPEQRAAHEADVRKHLAEIRLHQVRHLREMTQAEVAAELNIDQTGVSKLENRDDMRVSTLRDYIEAIGGRLEMHAVFPDQTITVELGK